MTRMNSFVVLVLLFCTDIYINGEISSGTVIINSPHDNSSIDTPPATVDKVNIQLYYETFCPYCRTFYTAEFIEVVQRLNGYLNVQTYPYGNAQTSEDNGKYDFKCQHGPRECYGNILHACALSIIQNQTEALLYNSCMMKSFQTMKGSDDKAADECGTSMNIDSQPIKTCAKGEKGMKLLKHYGDESIAANVQYVPYILVNDKENENDDDFMRDVCAAYANPPPPCALIV